MENTKTLPEPIAYEGRGCFGIRYFASKADAEAYGQHVRDRGDRYNGGWLDGTRCGRDYSFDRTVDGVQQFAVTIA